MRGKPDNRDRESALCCGTTRAEMVSDQLRGRQLSDRVNDMGFSPGAPSLLEMLLSSCLSLPLSVAYGR